jgi:hypothetical protein
MDLCKKVDEFDPDRWKDGPAEHHSVTLSSFCDIKFSFATNGYQSGDWGHGSRLLLEIEDLGCTAIEARNRLSPNGGGKLSILVGGDAELRLMAEGFELLGKRVREVLENR